MSRHIRTLRDRINGEHYLCLKLVKMSQNPSLDSKQQYLYKMQLSYLNVKRAFCEMRQQHRPRAAFESENNENIGIVQRKY